LGRGITVDGLSVPGRVPNCLATGKDAAVALRYEKIELVPRPSGAGELSGIVATITCMGPAIRFEIGVQEGLTAIADIANTGLSHNLNQGDRLWLRWPPDAATVLVE
jgi:ABC-type Fe3+/spermidine/putrescine transport system ATPase subunit